MRLAAALILAAVSAVAAAGIDDRFSQAREFFPGADRFGDLDGEPPAAEVYRDGQLIGYVFQTIDVLQIPAYSGKPINTLVGLDLEGRIAGVRIVEHEEPILVIGISDEDLHAFVDQYRGKSAFDELKVGVGDREGYVNIDAISGATITVMVENASIARATRMVAVSRGLPKRSPATPVSAGTDADQEPIWITVWRERVFHIVVLMAGLGILTLILVFQDVLARHPRALRRIRIAFLLYTVLFIGWYGLAQLSVVNVLTFAHAAMHDFRWDNFLIDPMMFILWAFVAVTLLLWGRGVYCGWLCPFGALQELIQQAARRLGVRQFDFPDAVHERLWAVKYVVLLALFGLSLQSLTEAERYAEVEPFKTAFVMQFDRQWPFVAYALGLLAVSAVNRKLFCKYLCPLGAALTIPGRFRIFDWWLRRRKECGHPCQICANECEVHAIRPTGEINANECHYCLDCQVTYYDDNKCPPLVDKRRRRERGKRARMVAEEMEASLARNARGSVEIAPPRHDYGE
jgi:polyferredoxin